MVSATRKRRYDDESSDLDHAILCMVRCSSNQKCETAELMLVSYFAIPHMPVDHKSKSGFVASHTISSTTEC